MFRVVDVLRAVSYTVAEDEWIFSSLLWIFSCVSWSTPCSKKRRMDYVEDDLHRAGISRSQLADDEFHCRRLYKTEVSGGTW